MAGGRALVRGRAPDRPALDDGGTLALSLHLPWFLPGILTTGDKAALLLIGLAWGSSWASSRSWAGRGSPCPGCGGVTASLTTGLIVGVLWGAWHFLHDLWAAAASPERFPLAVSARAASSRWLPAYRVLMVWVYDRTESLLVAMLMHASLVSRTLILMPLPAIRGARLDLYPGIGRRLWVVVAAVAVANGGQFSRPLLWRRAA